MVGIYIPFSREMTIAAIEGRKIATTRSERKGEIGDTFILEDPTFGDDPSDKMWKNREVTFRIIDIWTWPLNYVKYNFYRIEGFNSPEEFEQTWRALHRGHYTNKQYFIHFFGKVS